MVTVFKKNRLEKEESGEPRRYGRDRQKANRWSNCRRCIQHQSG